MLRHAEHGHRVELLHRAGGHPGLRAANPAEAALTEGYGHIAFDVPDLDGSARPAARPRCPRGDAAAAGPGTGGPDVLPGRPRGQPDRTGPARVSEQADVVVVGYGPAGAAAAIAAHDAGARVLVLESTAQVAATPGTAAASCSTSPARPRWRTWTRCASAGRPARCWTPTRPACTAWTAGCIRWAARRSGSTRRRPGCPPRSRPGRTCPAGTTSATGWWRAAPAAAARRCGICWTPRCASAASRCATRPRPSGWRSARTGR